VVVSDRCLGMLGVR